MSVGETLKKIQTKLIAPKGQFNDFGKYKYRSCEDILEALKPLLLETNSSLTISDEMVFIGNRYYVKAVATLLNGSESISVNGFAREPESRKGMDESQITGATSSYARKYALNGLFAIDDAKDADAMSGVTKVEVITEKQLSIILDLLVAKELSEKKLLEFLKLERLEDLPAKDYMKCLAAINSAKKKGA